MPEEREKLTKHWHRHWGLVRPIEIIRRIGSMRTRLCSFGFLILSSILLQVATAQWAFQTTGSNDANYREVAFFDMNKGVIVSGAGALYYTSDAGIAWEKKISSNAWNLSKVSSTTAYCMGNALFRTTNAGMSWTQLATDLDLSNVNAFQFISSQVGIAAGSNGAIWRTTNGGQNWTKVQTSITNSLYAVHFPDATRGWAAGNFGILFKTTDAGLTWNLMSVSGSPSVKKIFFTSASTGWATDNVALYKTVDGGTSWNNVYVGGSNLFDICFIDANRGWLAGNKIWSTTDGGNTWNSVAGVTYVLREAIEAIDPNNIWAVGNDNQIMTNVRRVFVVYPNGGESFNVGDATSIAFRYFNLSSVKIDYSTNNGTSWLPVVSSTPATTRAYGWTIPSTPSSQCLVRITDTGGTGFADQSDGMFSIVSSSQTLLSVAPSDQPVGSSAGNTSFSVSNAGTGTMSWTASSNQTWATITSGSSGSNTGTISVSYAANSSTTAARTATITVTAPGATGSPKAVTVTQAAAAPDGDLLVYYPLNGNANDASGNGHNGVSHGGVAWTTDRNGNPNSAVLFNGTDSYIDCGAVHPSNVNCSISLWFKTNARVQGDYSGLITDGGNYQGFTLNQNLDTIRFAYQGSNWVEPTWGIPQSAVGQWKHLALVYTSGHVSMYINGALVSTVAGDAGTIQTYLTLKMGADALITSKCWNGALDEVRLYNRALTLAEIQALYNPPDLSNGLLVYYPLNGNANDASGNGHNGVSHGGVAWTTDRNGNPNSAVLFNGTDSYIDCGAVHPSNVNCSISLWFKTNARVQGDYSGLITDGGNYQGFTLNQNLDTIRFAYQGSNWVEPTWGIPQSAVGQWKHLALVYTSGHVSMYINGALVSTVAGDAGTIQTYLTLKMGADALITSKCWNGALDEVRLYNRALTLAEIQALSSITAIEDRFDDLIPATFVLSQNYPNPFNPSTTIRYGLPNRSHVSLTVFNTLGQQVSIPQNGDQDPGYHEVRFDGSGLPSGVYFYRMQAGSFTETRKLLLVR
jgi:photosystem II stability/assembly factor-like uncharacterized protein